MISTKIVATIGPASSSEEVFTKLVKSGLRVARLAFSHGNHEEKKQVIKTIRKVSKKLGLPVAIMQDIQGPRVRVGVLKEPKQLQNGEHLRLISPERYHAKNENELPIQSYGGNVFSALKKGETVLLRDGTRRLEVMKTGKDFCDVAVLQGGEIFSHQGVNVPDASFQTSVLTPKDRADICFGLEQGVDLIAASFVESAEDMRVIRAFVKKNAKKQEPLLIAKIERKKAVASLEKIIAASDGVLVARGDLGVELSLSLVPVIQKQIIDECLAQRKPVIVATQMLESMIQNAQPTRAEVSDIAHAVMNHADAVMLSAETSIGKHPVASVIVMQEVCREVESSAYNDVGLWNIPRRFISFQEQEVLFDFEKSQASTVVILHATPQWAAFFSSLRQEVKIFACTDQQDELNRFSLYWGVTPVFSMKKKIKELLQEMAKKEYLKKDQHVFWFDAETGKYGVEKN